ncbi:MAG: hypothetical protein JO216_13795 [Hyphomicrobiales bacterium]|nr:hypothetical protein [Hyphomicrobiales bacterium]
MNRCSLMSAARSLSCSLVFALSFQPSLVMAQSTNDNTIFLNQAWSQEDREWYYHFSQGSAALSYDIFLNLEVPESQNLFRSDVNSERYGLIPEAASSYNPDGLPIGISKTTVTEAVKGWRVGDYAGLTCAACHEEQWNYKGKRIRIEGATSHALDLQAYVRALDEALRATLADAAKFDRLAARVGASGVGPTKNELRERMQSEAAYIHEYSTRTAATPHSWGPGRMDALTMINNRLTSILTGIDQNSSTPIAPVKPPFLWNAPQGLWTQWAGIAQDPIYRNMTETAGSYLPIDLRSKTPAEGLFQSAAHVAELERVEDQLARLAPPSWPEDVFGKIDRAKAARGKALFVELCAGCHNAWPYRWTEPNKYGKRFVIVGLTPQSYVGTDRTQFEAVRRFAITGDVRKYFPPEFKDKEVLPSEIYFLLLQDSLIETALKQLNLTEAQAAHLHGYRELPIPPPPQDVYKAAPRDGVWATAPFMHNGSVPNLYEMLIPAAQRTKKFWLGGDFDPVKVGFDTSATSGTFLMDTTLLGNSNAGHSFQEGARGYGTIGPLLTDEQRWALVEYLKSIPEQAGRVTPFGGPSQ